MDDLQVHTFISDGNGGVRPCPELLTEAEAILFLRLDTLNISHPAATLRRYRDRGDLRAIQVSKGVFYPVQELRRFIARQAEVNPR